MTLLDARSLFVSRRQDWRRGHLNWLPRSLYRSRKPGKK